MEKVGVEAVVEGLSGFLGDMRKMDEGIQSLIPSGGILGNVLSGVGDAAQSAAHWVGNVLAHAIGQLLADAVEWALRSLRELINDTIEAANEFQVLELRLNNLNFNELIKSGMSFNEAQRESIRLTEEQLDWLRKLAAQTPYDATDIAGVFTLAESYGFVAEEAKELTKTIVNFAAGMGLGNVEIERIIVNFGQMVQQGKVTGREMTDLARGAFVPVNDVLAKMQEQTGLTGKEFEAFRNSAEGVDAFMKAFATVVEERFSGAAEKMARTFKSATENARDFIKSIIGFEVLKPVLDEVGGKIAAFLDDLTNSTRWELITNAAAGIGSSLAWIVEKILGLAPSSQEMANKVVEAFEYIDTWLENHRQDIVDWVSESVKWIQERFIPALQELWKWLFGGSEEEGAIKSFFNWLSEFDLGSVFERILGIFRDLQPVLPPVIELLGAFGEVLIAAFGGDETQTFGEFVQSTLIPAIEDLTQFVRENKEVLADLVIWWIKTQIQMEIASAIFGVIISVVLKVIAVLGTLKAAWMVFSAILTPLTTILGAIAAALGTTVAGAIAVVVAAIIGLIGWIKLIQFEISLWGSTLPDVMNSIKESFVSAATAINAAWDTVIEKFRAGEIEGAFQTIWEAIKSNSEVQGGILVELIMSIAENLVTALAETLGMGEEVLADKVAEWVIAIDDAISPLSSLLLSSFVGIFGNVMQYVGSFPDRFYDLGTNLMQSMASGIESAMGWLIDAATNAATAAYDAAMSALSAGSPSKKFMDIGRFTMEGMAIGIAETTGEVTRAMSKAISNITAPAANAPAMAYSAATGQTSNTTNNYNIQNQLSINTSANSEPIIQDFEMMQSWSGV